MSHHKFTASIRELVETSPLIEKQPSKTSNHPLITQWKAVHLMKLFRQRTLISALSFFVFSISPLAAQTGKSKEEITWYDALENQQFRVEPQNLELLSIQVSKLPRDTFGHGKLPGGDSFVSSFVAASGTGIYGVFELATEGDLKYQEEVSSLEKFTDDRGTDLTKTPGAEDINEFFDSNKKLSVKLSSDQTKAVFTLRGYSTPSTGASAVKAAAKVVFLSLSQEKTETATIDRFEARQKIEIGPVTFSIHKAGTKPFVLPGRSARTVNPSFGNEEREWALQMDPRQKPVKNIELLDADNNIIKTMQGLLFDGKSHRYYLEKLPKQPKSIRVNWYEKWELITVPLEIETPLGI